MNDFLSKNSEVDGIVALGPVAADPALQAIKELNKVGEVKLRTFDTSPEILNATGLIARQFIELCNR